MSLMKRIENMDPRGLTRRAEVKALWEKGLYWSLAHRRSFKYPLGARMPKDGFLDYEPSHEPVPLDEVEIALLCWGAAGTNGLIRNDLSFAQDAHTHPWFEGRVYPSGCNVWYLQLLFSNDEGTFLYRPHVPTRTVEIEAQEDLETVFRAFKEGVVQLSDQPIRLTRDTPGIPVMNRDFMFQPGVTTFFPIVDLTVEVINLLILGAGHNYRRQIVDDEAGEPAGVRRWIEEGYLTGDVRQWSQYETAMVHSLIGHTFYVQQNLLLCAAAMGLGGYITAGGPTALRLMGETLTRPGTRLRLATDKRGKVYPVGIDGVLEAHLPPYLSMDEAVDDVWNMKFQPGSGRYSPDVRDGDRVFYRGFDPQPRAVVRPYRQSEAYCRAAPAQPPEAVQIAKDVANYIFDRYGRFPKIFDPIVCDLQVQISHVDVDFYDRYQVMGSTWPEHREHLASWHGCESA